MISRKEEIILEAGKIFVDRGANQVKNPYAILGAGVLTGLFSGLLGIGGGAVMIPIMSSVWKVPQHTVIGTSLAVTLPTALVGSLMYQQQGNLDLMLALKITLGSIFGAYIGSTLACRLPAATLQILFGGLLILMGIRMVIG